MEVIKGQMLCSRELPSQYSCVINISKPGLHQEAAAGVNEVTWEEKTRVTLQLRRGTGRDGPDEITDWVKVDENTALFLNSQRLIDTRNEENCAMCYILQIPLADKLCSLNRGTGFIM